MTWRRKQRRSGSKKKKKQRRNKGESMRGEMDEEPAEKQTMAKK